MKPCKQSIHIFCLAFVCFFCALFPITAVTLRTYNVGEEKGWDADLVRRNVDIYSANVQERPGLRLSSSEMIPDRTTKLLLTFDRKVLQDESGNYSILPLSRYTVSSREKKHGTGSAVFGKGDSLYLQALEAGSRKGMFAPDSVWEDVTIEFWFYPLLLKNNTTILHWKGSRMDAADRVVQQSLRVYVENSKLVWVFENIFQDEENRKGKTLTVTSQTMLLPRLWHYHVLRYHADSGRIEYSKDSNVEQIVYATVNGNAEGARLYPYIEDYRSSSFTLAENMRGLLDAVRISEGYYSPISLPLLVEEGTCISLVHDTGSLGATLTEVLAEFTAEEGSDLLFQYRVADSIASPYPETALDAPWQTIEANKAIGGSPEGRFVQLKVQFLSGAQQTVSPLLHSLRLSYYPNLPVQPPDLLRATEQDGGVLLEWTPVYDSSLAGYYVYYGNSPDNFFGTESLQGKSPILVTDATSLFLNGFREHSLRYFAVASVSAHGPVYGHDIRFSPTVGVRIMNTVKKNNTPLPEFTGESVAVPEDAAILVTRQ